MSIGSRRNFLKYAAILPMSLFDRLAIARKESGKPPHALVLGGGFAGLNAAISLKAFLPGWHVTVIEAEDSYTCCPGSNAVISGFKPLSRLMASPERHLMSKGIHYRKATAVGLDPQKRHLLLKDGQKLAYERLIVAPGIGFRWDTLEGYSETVSHTIPHAFRAGAQTQILKAQLSAMRQGGVFLMTVPAAPYRCPPGPYERASLMAARFQKTNPRAKILILDAKSKFPKERAFRAAWSERYPGMIDWLSFETEGQMERLDPKRREIVTEFSRIGGDVLNLIPPQKAAPIAERLGLTDDSGWCPVEPATFKARGFENIHVIGDAARYDPVPKSAFAAQTEGRLCALAIALESLGQTIPAPRLINHCYSLVAEAEAISVTGIYGIPTEGAMEIRTLSVQETGPDGDFKKEAAEAEDWIRLLLRSTFGMT